MTGSIVKLFPDPEDCFRVADNEHNRTARENQGPPIGSLAWVCTATDECDSFAFYVTTGDIRCYHCHAPQSF